MNEKVKIKKGKKTAKRASANQTAQKKSSEPAASKSKKTVSSKSKSKAKASQKKAAPAPAKKEQAGGPKTPPPVHRPRTTAPPPVPSHISRSPAPKRSTIDITEEISLDTELLDDLKTSAKAAPSQHKSTKVPPPPPQKRTFMSETIPPPTPHKKTESNVSRVPEASVPEISIEQERDMSDPLIPIDEEIDAPTVPLSKEVFTHGMPFSSPSVSPPPSEPVVAPTPASRRTSNVPISAPEPAPPIEITPYVNPRFNKPSPAVLLEDTDQILQSKADQGALGPEKDIESRATALIASCKKELSLTSNKLRIARLNYDIAAAHELFLNDGTKALQYYQTSLEALPQYLPSLRSARRLLLAQKSYPSVLKLLDTENRLEGVPKQKALLLYLKGRILEDVLHQQTKAKQCYLQAIEIAPGCPEIIDAMIQVELKAKNWPALITLLEQAANAIQTDPEFQANLVAERARILDTRLNATAEAVETYHGALALNPRTGGVVPPLKRLMYQQSRWRELITLLENEIEDTEHPEIKAAGLIQISRIHGERLGNQEPAVEALERAYKLTPDNSYILEELTRYLEKLDNPGNLVDALKRLADTLPSLTQKVGIHHRIGQIFDKQLRDPSSAASWHEQALSLDPAYIPSLRALGDLYERLGNWDALIAMYVAEAHATKNTIRRADAHVHIAELYEYKLNNPTEAAKHHAQALSLVPGLESSFKSLTRIYTLAKQYPALIKLYEKASEHAESEDLRFTYLFKIGSLYEDALNDPKSALEVYRRIHQTSPKHLGAIHAVQRAAEMSGNFKDYVDMLKKEAVLTMDSKRKVFLLQKAAEVTQEKLEEFEAALAAYKKVLDIEENYPPALAGIGRLYHKLGRWNSLLGIYHRELKLSELKDDKLGLLMKMAELSETHIGDEEGAIKYYRRAIDIDPTFIPALHALCKNLEKRGDFDGLTSIIQKELDSTTDANERARVSYRLGEVLEVNRNNPIKAAEAYREAIKAHPTYRPALDALTRVTGALKRHQEMADAFMEEAKLGGEERVVIEALFQAGVVYNDYLNDATKAIKAFEQILNIEPTHVPTLLALVPLYRDKAAYRKLSQAYVRLTRAVQDPKEKVGLYKELVRVLQLAGEEKEIPNVHKAVLAIAPSDTTTIAALEVAAIATGDWNLLADVDSLQIRLTGDPALQAVYLSRMALAVETVAPGAALKSYSDAVAFDPDGLMSIRGIKSLAARIDDADLKIEALRKEAEWTDSQSKAADLLVKSADINIKVKTALESAVSDLKEALKRCPDHGSAAEKVYKILSGAHQYDLLIEILSNTADAISDKDQKAELYATVANLHATMRKDIGAAISTLTKMLQTQPNHIPTMLHLVDLYKNNRQWEEASKILEKVIKLRPNKKVLAEVLLDVATIYAKHLNDLLRAITHIGNLLQTDPKNLPALMMLCEIQFKRGKFDDAGTSSEKLLGLVKEPEAKAKALLLAAQIRLKKGARKSAAKLFREAIALGGPSNTAWAKDYYSLLGKEETWSDYLGALIQYQKNLKTTPDVNEKQIACAAEIARVQHEGLGKVDDAVATLRQGLKRFGKSRLLSYHLAKRLAGGKRFDEAIEELTHLIAEDSTQPDVWRLFAYVYRALGKPREAACALAPLVVLHEATREERSHAGQALSSSELGAPGSFGGQNLWDVSPKRPCENRLTALLQTIEDALSKVYTPDLHEYGLSTGDQLGTGSGHPARTLVSQIANIFGVSEYHLYINPSSNTEALIELTQPVSILIPAQILNLSEEEKVFFIARIFAYIAKNQHAILKIGQEQLKLIIAGLTHKHTPRFAGDLDYETLDRIGKRIIKATSWRSRRAVEDAALYLAQSANVDVDQCLEGMEFGAVRAASILCGDLSAAVTVVQNTDPQLTGMMGKALVAKSPIIKDLLPFWISPDAFTLRKRAGLM